MKLKWQISYVCPVSFFCVVAQRSEDKLGQQEYQESLFFAAVISMNPKDFLLCCKMQQIFECLLR